MRTIAGTSVRCWVVVTAVVALGSTSGCAAADDDGSTILAASVGDCLNDKGRFGNIESIPVVRCAGPHDSEVYYEFDATGDGYPRDPELSRQAEEGCRTAFAAFVGVEYGRSHYRYAAYTPISAAWDQAGGREISCVISDPDGQTTGTLESIGR